MRQAATELGYQRSPTAPAVANIASRLIAMSVADIGNPVFVEVIGGAEEEAHTIAHDLITTIPQKVFKL